MTYLTPNDHALLRHLKREVDHYQDKSLRTGEKHPNIQQDLWRARKELKEFVAELRKQGKNI
jgi:predicted  nucleic acid-binding Zn-ribbon protein